MAHNDVEDHTLWVRALMSLGSCVSPPTDWAVSIGSHAQQNMDISQAPPRPSTPLPSLETTHVRSPDPKNGCSFSKKWSSVRVATRVSRPARLSFTPHCPSRTFVFFDC